MVRHELKQGQTGTVESWGLTDRTEFVTEQSLVGTLSRLLQRMMSSVKLRNKIDKSQRGLFQSCLAGHTVAEWVDLD